MTVRMRHTRAHTANRRSHHALEEARLSKCTECSAMHLRHRACGACGTYRGKNAVDVNKKAEKLIKKTAKASAGAKAKAESKKEEAKTG